MGGQRFLLTGDRASGQQILHQPTGFQTTGACSGKKSCNYQNFKMMMPRNYLDLKVCHDEASIHFKTL
jgi:hypothetical protein